MGELTSDGWQSCVSVYLLFHSSVSCPPLSPLPQSLWHFTLCFSSTASHFWFSSLWIYVFSCLFFLSFIYLWRHCMSQNAYGCQRIIGRIWWFPSIIWIPRTKLRVSELGDNHLYLLRHSTGPTPDFKIPFCLVVKPPSPSVCYIRDRCLKRKTGVEYCFFFLSAISF